MEKWNHCEISQKTSDGNFYVQKFEKGNFYKGLGWKIVYKELGGGIDYENILFCPWCGEKL